MIGALVDLVLGAAVAAGVLTTFEVDRRRARCNDGAGVVVDAWTVPDGRTAFLFVRTRGGVPERAIVLVDWVALHRAMRQIVEASRRFGQSVAEAANALRRFGEVMGRTGKVSR